MNELNSIIKVKNAIAYIGFSYASNVIPKMDAHEVYKFIR